MLLVEVICRKRNQRISFHPFAHSSEIMPADYSAIEDCRYREEKHGFGGSKRHSNYNARWEKGESSWPGAAITFFCKNAVPFWLLLLQRRGISRPEPVLENCMWFGDRDWGLAHRRRDSIAWHPYFWKTLFLLQTSSSDSDNAKRTRKYSSHVRFCLFLKRNIFF